MGANRNKQGLCGHCKSENIDYDSAKHNGDYVEYKYECNDCGSQGSEYYDLKFTENVIHQANTYKHNSYILYPSCSEESLIPKNSKYFERTELQKILGGYLISCKGIYGELILFNMDGETQGLEYNRPASNRTRGENIWGKAIIINKKTLFR